MSRIRSKNTTIEKIMNEMLLEIGCRYIPYPKMFGSPDFVVPKQKIAIFCDGDFWHGYRYNQQKPPKKQFWKNKIEGNMKRDRSVNKKLRSEGWSVLRFWEHDIHQKRNMCIRKISMKIKMRQDNSMISDFG